jgi:hypothetical protein
MQRLLSRYDKDATSDPLAVVTPAETVSRREGEGSNGTVGSILSCFVRGSRMLGAYCNSFRSHITDLR